MLRLEPLIVLGILMVITITYFTVIYRTQSAAAEDVQISMAQIERQIEADATKASRVPPMLREIEKMKQRYNKDWDRRLPRRKELAGFLREIAAGLSEESLSNQFIQPGNPARRPLYNCLPITMKFEGNIFVDKEAANDCLNFLQKKGYEKKARSLAWRLKNRDDVAKRFSDTPLRLRKYYDIYEEFPEFLSRQPLLIERTILYLKMVLSYLKKEDFLPLYITVSMLERVAKTTLSRRSFYYKKLKGY